MPDEKAVRFVLEMLNLPPLTSHEREWFYSDWEGDPERTFGQRLSDLLESRTPDFNGILST